MDYKAEDYIIFVEEGRRDKVSPEGLRLIAEKFKKLEEIAKRHEELGNKIDECYMHPDGELRTDEEMGLDYLGEIVASHFGWLGY